MRKIRLIHLLLCIFLITSPFLSETKAQVTFSNESGLYGNLLNDLKKNLYENSLTREMAASGIKTYQKIGGKTKSVSVAPWFGIYLPLKTHFGSYV